MKTQWLSVTALTWAAVCGFAVSIVLGPLFGEYGSFHYLHLALAIVFAIAWVRHQGLSGPISPRAWTALLIASLVWLEAAALSTFASFGVGGIDFSIFDWMLASASRGHLGDSPIYAVNHFGVHSTFVLALLAPLHALVPSPLWLVTIGPAVLWAGLFPLRRLVLRAVPVHHGAVLLAASLAFVAGTHLGRLTTEAFRIESLIPVGTLWFLVGWTERRRGLWIAAVVFLFCTKEDATLYLGSFATACALFDRERRVEGIGLLLACFAWLGLYSQLIQPALTGRTLGYITFWSDFGSTPGAVLAGMASRPLTVLTRLFTSGAGGYFAPLLFLPWLSWRAAAGLAPTVFLLGTATYETMHNYLSYYPTPLLAFALFGVLEVLREHSSRAWMAAALLALLLFPLVGLGYARVTSFDVGRLREVATVREYLVKVPHVCAQTVLFPHLGYPADLQPLFELSCADRPDTWVVASEQFDSWPLGAPALQEAIGKWRASRPVTEVGPFLIFGPKR